VKLADLLFNSKDGRQLLQDNPNFLTKILNHLHEKQTEKSFIEILTEANFWLDFIKNNSAQLQEFGIPLLLSILGDPVDETLLVLMIFKLPYIEELLESKNIEPLRKFSQCYWPYLQRAMWPDSGYTLEFFVAEKYPEVAQHLESTDYQQKLEASKVKIQQVATTFAIKIISKLRQQHGPYYLFTDCDTNAQYIITRAIVEIASEYPAVLIGHDASSKLNEDILTAICKFYDAGCGISMINQSNLMSIFKKVLAENEVMLESKSMYFSKLDPHKGNILGSQEHPSTATSSLIEAENPTVNCFSNEEIEKFSSEVVHEFIYCKGPNFLLWKAKDHAIEIITSLIKNISEEFPEAFIAKSDQTKDKLKHVILNKVTEADKINHRFLRPLLKQQLVALGYKSKANELHFEKLTTKGYKLNLKNADSSSCTQNETTELSSPEKDKQLNDLRIKRMKFFTSMNSKNFNNQVGSSLKSDTTEHLSKRQKRN
ncbi:MAG: hypothetical protein AAGG80_00975, partial [Pseudomonadota bacterium]